MVEKFLYRRLGCAVIAILALFGGMVAPGMAQGRPELKRPEEAPEKPPAPKKKKVKGPRAVGIVQFNSAGKATLIPVAILVDGKFYDASAYKAEPVPMALQPGTVYEVEKTGDSQGLFTINGALHSKNTASAHPWVGSGSYAANGTEMAKATRKAEDVPVGMDSGGDEPPRLTHGSGAKTAEPSGSSGAKDQKQADGGGSDKKADGQTSTDGSPGDANKTQASQGQNGRDQGAQGQAGQDQTQQSGNYYRPTLRRGKPTETAPAEEEDIPRAAKGGSSVAASAAGGEPLKLVPAISDEGGPEPRSYKFFWKTGEEDERRDQMLELAGNAVRTYASALAKNQIPAAKPAVPAKAAPRKTAAKPVQPEFENVHFDAFDVWGNSQPVMILTCEAHLPAVTAAGGGLAAPGSYSVTLVAKTDIYGNLRKLYTGVTDRFHLDVTPELELVDAVDADGDGRGELLFSETTDAGRGYAIYRATADKLWKMFDSLGAE